MRDVPMRNVILFLAFTSTYYYTVTRSASLSCIRLTALVLVVPTSFSAKTAASPPLPLSPLLPLAVLLPITTPGPKEEAYGSTSVHSRNDELKFKLIIGEKDEL